MKGLFSKLLISYVDFVYNRGFYDFKQKCDACNFDSDRDKQKIHNIN